MSNVTAYYRFEVLGEEVRTLNGFKSPNRYDCTATYNPTAHGLLPLFQSKRQMLFLYLNPVREVVRTDKKRQATYFLGNGDMNLSSLHVERPEFSRFAYGYCNGKDRLNDGRINPAAPYKHDALLMLCDWQRQVIEVLVIQEGKPLIDNLYSLLIDGEFEEDLQRLRGMASPYYAYKIP